MSFIFLFFSSIIVFSNPSFAQTNCHDYTILSVKKHRDYDKKLIQVTFDKKLNGTHVHEFNLQYCQQFYDSFICDYKSDRLNGWVISSYTDEQTYWSVHRCTNN
jgi:hypothetical protein